MSNTSDAATGAATNLVHYQDDPPPGLTGAELLDWKIEHDPKWRSAWAEGQRKWRAATHVKTTITISDSTGPISRSDRVARLRRRLRSTWTRAQRRAPHLAPRRLPRGRGAGRPTARRSRPSRGSPGRSSEPSGEPPDDDLADRLAAGPLDLARPPPLPTWTRRIAPACRDREQIRERPAISGGPRR